MSSTRTVTAALALAAALIASLPAAATPRPATPRTVQISPTGLVHEGLAWLAALWGGGRERATAARAESGGTLSPGAGTTAVPTSFVLAPRPAGSGIDPDGFF